MEQEDRDPLAWCAILALAFLALAGWNIETPHKLYFDEIHYVPAARKLLALKAANLEHPMVGKEAIAAAIRVLGDRPLAWRLPALLAGGLGLFAFGRMIWWASRRRCATLAGMVLLATDFAWFIQSRIAMLDMVMAAFAVVALWMVAAAIACPRQARWRLALAGLAMGLSIGAKWSAVPALALPGLALVAARIGFARKDIAQERTALPIPGMSLFEIVLWLGSLPLLAYWLTYIPGFHFRDTPVTFADPVAWHRYMLALQDSVTASHPYQSTWIQWIGDWRAIWYLYEVTDGAQRGIVLIGNPLTMIAGLPALGWCLWEGWRRRMWGPPALVALYVASIAMWALSGKPVQFYYHYLMPGSFLIAALALALDRLWRERAWWRWGAPALLAGSCALFAWFYPIIAALPLHDGKASFEHWMWLASWR
jgi:dolichyl-phosphate-mannose--protein O-mannosyl transferase